MIPLKLLIIAIFFAAVCADRIVVYDRQGVPSSSYWEMTELADDEQKVTFTITLQRQNLDKLEEKWYAVSDPTSPEYSMHMSRKEITELIAAPVADQKKVLRWIKHTAASLPSGHLIKVDNQQDAIVVDSTALFASKLFETSMYFFINHQDDTVVVKHHGALSVPTEIRPLIAMISGITELAPPDTLKRDIQRPNAGKGNKCNVPHTMKKLYDWPENFTVTLSSSNVSVYSQDSIGAGNGFGIGAVLDWEQANNLPHNPINCIIGNGVSQYVNGSTDIEAQLDTQMVTGMAPGAKTCFYIMSPTNGWMYEFARYIYATPESPLVISMSYGWFENWECSSAQVPFLGNCTYYHIPNSQDYVLQANIEFMKLGVAGHTLLASSGDDGTAGGHSSDDNCATMGPQFPAASPFVTSVGATSVEPEKSGSSAESDLPPICTKNQFQCNCTTSTNEQPASKSNSAWFDSGGGFSQYSAMPKYQQAAVAGYIKSGVALPPTKYWNQTNRAYPDIAAVGELVCILSPGSPCMLVAGTSCSSPILAGMVTLLNNDRLAAGKKPLGPFNGVIYHMYAMNATKYFNLDFEETNNSGECPSDLGFNVKAGIWSPVVGCGSPKVSAIRKFVASLP